MSRVGTQSGFNNFTGGLVTEASPLSFPKNSLSVAKNIELNADGSVQARRPFKVAVATDSSYSMRSTDGFVRVKRFNWREKNRQVLVFISPTGYRFKVFNKEGLSSEGVYSLPSGVELLNPELINVSFKDDEMYFTVNTKDTNEFPSQYKSLLVKGYHGIASILFSSYYTVGESVYNYDRTPRSGYLLDYTLRTDNPFVGMVNSMNTGWYRREVYNSDGSHFSEVHLRWNSGSGKPDIDFASLYNLGGNGRVNFPNTVDIGDYTYYLAPGSQTVTRDATFPERDWDERHTIAGVYRTKKGSYVKVSKGSQPLRYRDFSGVPNIGYMGLDSIIKNDERHIELTAFNAYNLYNAGWGRVTGGGMLVSDEEGNTVSGAGESFVKRTKELVGVYPSLSDSQYDFITDDTSTKKAIGLYSPFLLSRNKPFSGMARRGSNILTLYREHDTTGYTKEHGSYFVPDFYVPASHASTSGILPYTSEFEIHTLTKGSPGKITASEYINGRMWYGVSNRDFNVMFSQVDYEGKDFSSTEMGNLVNCYQQGDPNGSYSSGLLATDGGTMVLKDVGIVHGFKEFRQHILLFASEGVWAISGGNRDSFSPTSFSISKVSSEGVLNSESFLVTDDALFYLSEKALHSITVNKYDVLVVDDLSSEKVLSGIREHIKLFKTAKSRGLVYDSENKRVIIDYNIHLDPVLNSTKSYPPGDILGSYSLVYDLLLGSFYEWNACSLRAMTIVTVYGISSNTYFNPSPSDKVFMADFGLMEYDGTIVRVFHDLDIFGDEWAPYTFDMAFKFDPLNPLQPWKNFYLCKQGIGSYGLLVDLPGDKPYGTQFYNTELEIPHDTSGVPYVDKGVRTLSFFQELSSDTIWKYSSPNNIKYPQPSLRWTWDWDTSKSGNAPLTSDIRYPEPTKVFERSVGISKIKVPGFGKALTLNITTGSNDLFYKILGFFTEGTMAGRS